MAQARDFVGIFVGINIFAGFVLLRYQYVIVLISVLSWHQDAPFLGTGRRRLGRRRDSHWPIYPESDGARVSSRSTRSRRLRAVFWRDVVISNLCDAFFRRLALGRSASRRCGARRGKERNSAAAKRQIYIAVITGHYGDRAPVTP
jgi:hypothetical protein